MILTSIISIAAAAVLVTGLFVFWDDIKIWLNKAVELAQKALNVAVIGVKVFIKKVDEAFQEIARTYQQDKHGQWHQTTVTKKVNASEVPPEILAKAKINQKEVDISNDVERELKLSL